MYRSARDGEHLPDSCASVCSIVGLHLYCKHICKAGDQTTLTWCVFSDTNYVYRDKQDFYPTLIVRHICGRLRIKGDRHIKVSLTIEVINGKFKRFNDLADDNAYLSWIDSMRNHSDSHRTRWHWCSITMCILFSVGFFFNLWRCDEKLH